jgi:hypothetical protein
VRSLGDECSDIFSAWPPVRIPALPAVVAADAVNLFEPGQTAPRPVPVPIMKSLRFMASPIVTACVRRYLRRSGYQASVSHNVASRCSHPSQVSTEVRRPTLRVNIPSAGCASLCESPSCLILPCHFRIYLALLKAEFRQQLAIALKAFKGKRAVVDRFPDCASRLAAVRTVAEFAALGQGGNVPKRTLCPFIMVPELEFAHSRRIDQHAFAGKEDHLTRRSGAGRGHPVRALAAHEGRRQPAG